MPADTKARDSKTSGGRQASASPGQRDENGQGSSLLRRTVTAGAIAAVAATTAAAAAKLANSRGSEGSGSQSGGRDLSGVREAARRGEPLLSAGWEAAQDSLTPLVESGARAAGSFVGERSPDFIRDSVIPPFIDGFNKGRKKGGS